MKLLTIVVPSYNVEKYLRKALDSYSYEDFRDELEVCIINDGSTDSTKQIAKEYVEKFPEIFKLINKENGGHGSTINVGLEVATGKYFRIIDGDDWVITENLKILLDYLRECNTDIVCDVKREVYMDTGKSELFPLPSCVTNKQIMKMEYVQTQNILIDYIMMHTASYKTDILKKAKIKILEHTFYVDYEFIVKASNYCNDVSFIDLEIYQYLVGNINQSVSTVKRVERYGQHYRVISSILDFYTKNDTYTHFNIRKLCILLNMHFMILLVMFNNKHEGRKLALEFRKELKEKNPLYYKKTTNRYIFLKICNYFHLSYNTLMKIRSIGK